MEKTGVLSQNVDAFYRLCLVGFRRRTPGPPPFSSMNATPAASGRQDNRQRVDAKHLA